MSPFDTYIKEVLAHEGGFVDDPRDRGGATNFGITEAVARAFGFTGDMRQMTKDQAILIYRRRYWEGPGFDKIVPLSEVIATRLLDIGVNTGPATAGRFLQRALNVLNQQGATFPDLTVDGALGALSRAALAKFLAARGKDGERVLHGMLRAQLSVYYIEISESRPTNEAFTYGWQINRAIGRA